MRLATIAKNFVFFCVFFVVLCFVLYNYHKLLTSRMSVPVNSGRLATEFLTDLFPFILAYSSILSGYFTAVAAEVKTPSIGFVSENPFIYFALLLIFYLGPTIAPFAIASLSISIVIQILTCFERPHPGQSIANKQLDTRYYRPDPAATFRPQNNFPTPLKFAARFGLFATIAVCAAPIAILVMVITVSTMVYGLILPSQESHDIVGAMMSAATLIIPVLISSWILVPPVLYAIRLAARVVRATEPHISNDGFRAIYLRRFSRDSLKHAYLPSNFWIGVLHALPGLQSAIAYTTRTRLEDSIIRTLAGSAQLITVGNPNESLPSLGATRVYIRDEDWKEEVRDLTRGADIIFLIVDFSDAIDWEIELLLSEDVRSRAVLIMPEPKRGKDWYDHWSTLRQKGLPLPAVTDKTAAVLFTNAGAPVCVDAIGHWKYWQDAVSGSLVRGLSYGGSGNETIEVDFGPRFRGSSITKGATAVVILTFALQVIAMLGIDVLEYFRVLG